MRHLNKNSFMTTDDLRLLARHLTDVLQMRETGLYEKYPEYQEPGMGTDYDCRIGEFYIKKGPLHCVHPSLRYIGSVGKDEWQCTKCGYVTPDRTSELDQTQLPGMPLEKS